MAQQPAVELTDVAQDISAGREPGCYIATLSIDSSAVATALYATAAMAPAADADYFPLDFGQFFSFRAGPDATPTWVKKTSSVVPFSAFPRPRQGGLSMTTDALEKRFCELRAEGRTLSGEALVYGDRAVFPWGEETIQSGAFGDVGDVILNRQHKRDIPLARTGGGGLELIDSPEALRISAELPDTPSANETLQLIRSKILRGLSIEFHATQERQDGDLRIIERAILVAVAVVDSGQYPKSLVSAREREERQARRLRTMRGSIPAEKALECRCVGGGDCSEALFESGALDAAIDPDQQADALAIVGEYSQAIGSRKRRSLRFWSDKKGGLEYAIDIPGTGRGRALIDSLDVVDMIARPVLDLDASEFLIDAGRATYTRAHVRALTLGPTDASRGWTPLRRRTSPGDDAPAGDAGRRRMRFFL